MNDWSHGYDVSMGYTYGFYREMAPAWMELAAGAAGLPGRRPERFRYLELGSGQGVGLCLLAAANPEAEFLGVDFMPDHIAHSQRLADEAGLANIRFAQADFLELAAEWPHDFGSFDYVTMHGVYSWVPEHVRDAVVACTRHATRAGSLVYISFNTLPGWLGTMPFQHITSLIKQTGGKTGPAVLDESVALFEKLRAGGAATFQILPALAARIDAVKKRNASYLVQEYLNESWRPRWHSEVATELAAADFAYVGTATLAETMLPGVLPPPLRDTIRAQADARLQQDLQDFVVNQSFRRDLFRRGPAGERAADRAALADTRLCLLAPPARNAGVKLDTAFGEIALQYPAFAGILQALAQGPRTIADLAALPGLREQGLASASQLLLLLVHAGILGIAAAPAASADAARRLNAVIARSAAQGAPYRHLAAPVLGSAVAATEAELKALHEGGTLPAQWAALGIG